MNQPQIHKTRPSPSYQDALTKFVRVRGENFAYRQLGPGAGVPLILLHHFTGNLDDWDPRVVDGLAARRQVIAFDNRGVGASSGSTPNTVESMADDAVAFIQALGYDQVDLLGFSLGGFIAQTIAQTAPSLVRRIILAGTGPAGGPGIDRIRGLVIRVTLKAVLRRKHPKHYLFFTETANGEQAARAFLARLKGRIRDRDKALAPSTFTAQLKAIHQWGRQPREDLSTIPHPVLVANGESDLMVPSQNTIDLADRLPHSQLVPLYPDAGHGGIFQYHKEFVPAALDFLESQHQA